MAGWKTSYLLGWLPGRCYVSFREGNSGAKFAYSGKPKKLTLLGTVPYPPYKFPALLIFPTFRFGGTCFLVPWKWTCSIHPSQNTVKCQCFRHFLWVFPKMVGFLPHFTPPSHGPFFSRKNPMGFLGFHPPFVGKKTHLSRKLVYLRVVDQSSPGIGRWEWSGMRHRAVRMQPLCLWQVRCRSGAWGRSSKKKREELHDYGHDLSASMRFSDWVVVF